MALSPQLVAAAAAPPPPDKYKELLQEASQDMLEADQVCHGTTFASTDEIEKTLLSLRKWHEEGVSRFGEEAMQYLRSQGIAPKTKTTRRINELTRVLNIRRESASGENCGREQPRGATEMERITSQQAAGPSLISLDKPLERPPVGHSDKGLSHETAIHHALPTPISANHPEHAISNGGSPVKNPQLQPRPRPLRDLQPQTTGGDLASPTNPLVCLQCRGEPLSCMHSHRLVEKMVQEELDHTTRENKERALDWLLHASRRDNPQAAASYDILIDQLSDHLEHSGRGAASPASHRKSKSAGSIALAPLGAQWASENRVASLPLKSPDKTTSFPQHQEKRGPAIASRSASSANLAPASGVAPSMNGHVAGRSHPAPHEPAPRDIPVAKRRSREERQWCKVCKSDGYWCIHRKEHEDPLPRSARLSALHYEGPYDSTMMDSPEDESFNIEATSKKRRRSGPQPKRAPPQLPLRGDS